MAGPAVISPTLLVLRLLAIGAATAKWRFITRLQVSILVVTCYLGLRGLFLTVLPIDHIRRTRCWVSDGGYLPELFRPQLGLVCVWRGADCAEPDECEVFRLLEFLLSSIKVIDCCLCWWACA